MLYKIQTPYSQKTSIIKKKVAESYAITIDTHTNSKVTVPNLINYAVNNQHKTT